MMKLRSVNFNVIVIILTLSLLTSCSSVYKPQEVAPTTSSESFIKAKYLTELVYITRNKNLIRQYRSDFISRKINKPKYRDINKWATGKDNILVIKTIDLFLDLEFEGI